ncbi:MAG: N-acetylneuraminate synthase [Muribaculaceae bacterium]|nr:N-acetylneuraminate synthase [Muribaculaceae bacterium]
MKRTIIIAEAGVNHNGSLGLARKLVDKAVEAGADYIKFQTFKAEKLVNKGASQAEYQKRNIGKEESQLEMLKKLELTFDDFRYLDYYCQESGIKFMSTPFDSESIDILSTLGMDYMKVPSGEITNLPYLKKIARAGIPVIMSTGMCSLGMIEDALGVLYKNGLSKDDITLLHCNTEYPTPMVDVNLRAMETLHSAFGTKVGYSDHTKGIEVPIAATAMGATVIEKHFTLDRTLPGPDHIASLEPAELKAMVDAIRNIELAMGSSVKKVSASEKKNISVARKSIVALKPIKKGETFCEDNLTVKRPGNGISPMKWDGVIGLTAKRNFEVDELIEL